MRVPFGEVAVRERVRQAAGKWNRDRKLWELRDDQAAALELAGRIVQEPASTSGCQEERAEYLYVDASAAIQMEMLAYTGGCQHLVLDVGVAVQL